MTNDLVPSALNAAIRAEMARRDKRQEDIASALGIAQSQVSLRLAGRIEWRVSEIEAVARELGVPVSTLLDGAA